MDHMHGMQHADAAARGAFQGPFRFPMPASSDQGFSEFNHHLSGAVVLLVGLSAILMYYRPKTFSFLRFVWPASLIALGIYLVLYSDPNAWPLAYKNAASAFTDPEVRQHKIYALLVLGLGGIEILRASNVLRRDFWKYSFPVSAAFGATYLLLHTHGAAGDHQSMDMASHTGILYQHIIYLILGVEAVAAWILSSTRRITGPWAVYLWPALVSFVGIALILYRE